MIKRLLVIRFSALGDIAMTVPVVAAVCRSNPDLEVTMLTSPLGAKIYKAATADIANLTIMGINPKKDYAGIGGLNRLYKELRALQFDAIADLHDVLRTQWIRLRFKMAGTQVRHIDKGRKDKRALVKHKINQALMPQIQRYRQVFEALGIETGEPVHPLTAHDVMPLAIGIAPFAQHKGKIYPTEQMKQVVRLVAEQRPDAHIYLFGGPDEQAELDQWTELAPSQIEVVAGRQSIADDIALMARLQLVVSMDSANMHLASLIGTRVLSIWGATHPNAGFLGFGQDLDDAIQLPLPCRPCSIFGNKPCKLGDYRCMTGITPQLIADRICQHLQ